MPPPSSLVNGKHIRTVTVNKKCDSEVEPYESKGVDDNAVGYRTGSESDKSDNGPPFSTMTGSSTDKLPGPAIRARRIYRWSNSKTNRNI